MVSSQTHSDDGGLLLSGKVEAALTPQTIQLLRLIGEEGDRQGTPVYHVGGFVRDLLLGLPNADHDLVVEGDAIRLAHRLAALTGADMKSHGRFGTATLCFTDGSHLDLATARTEDYARPGALPDVEPSSIEEDLHRRDFTLNAMAIRLGEHHFGELYDPFNGVSDLHRKELRILHDSSFVDDPTRIMRAARFEARFGFRMEPHTRRLVDAAMREGRLETLTPERFQRELLLGLRESLPWSVMERWELLGVLDHLSPGLRPDAALFRRNTETLEWFAELGQPETPDRTLLLLVALLASLSPEDAGRVCHDRLHLGAPKRERLEECLRFSPRLAAVLASIREDIPQLTRRLKSEKLEVILYALSLEPTLREPVDAFFTRYRHVKLETTGDDLVRQGYRPGPRFGEALGSALDAKLRGELSHRDEELKYLRARLNAPLETLTPRNGTP